MMPLNVQALILQTAAAFLAIYGFSIILNVPKKFLTCAGAAGGLCWFVYLLAIQTGSSLILAAFLSSFAVAVFSQILARILKAPVTVFLVAGILPTVPGASVYRCVYCLIQGLTELSTVYLIQTVQIAGAMALAIFIVDSVFRFVQKN